MTRTRIVHASLFLTLLLSTQAAVADPGFSRGQVRREVRAASDQWIDNFNDGNVDGIANAYEEDGIMWAEPFGVFEGRPAIRTFWNDLIASGATDLRYRRRRIRVISETVAIVSADWSMNIGGGIIYQEKWVKQADTGEWLLRSDHFDVLFTND